MYEREIPRCGTEGSNSYFEEQFLKECGIPWAWAKELATWENELGEHWRKMIEAYASPKLSKKELQESEKEGGADLQDYEAPDEKISCDKGGHRERSLVNQPNHLIFWKHERSTEDTQREVRDRLYQGEGG